MMQTAIFENYRKQHPDLQEEQLEILNLLQADDRMPKIWAGFAEQSATVLAIIISRHWRASVVAQKPQMLTELSEKFERLLAAEEILNGHFSTFIAGDDSAQQPSIIERTGKIRNAVASLDWMRSWLREEEQMHRFFIDRFSPTSQKNGSPLNAFGVMLCNEFTDALGQPYYDQAATITDVVFLTEEATSVASIRMRLIRDRQTRKKDRLRPWKSADEWFDNPADD